MTTAFPLAATELPSDAIEVGRIGDAWGVKGWFKVLPHSAQPQALFAARRWYLQPSEKGARTFSGTAIKEAGIKDIGAFTDNLLDPSKPIMRVVEQNRTVQNSQGIGFFSSFFNTFYALIGL